MEVADINDRHKGRLRADSHKRIEFSLYIINAGILGT
jgi:hypothetical protein